MIMVIAGITFEWDDAKAKLVIKEHQVTFEECCTAILDENSITQEDYRDYGEERFITVGMSDKGRILTVIWTPRGDSIRLITGFKANSLQILEYQL